MSNPAALLHDQLQRWAVPKGKSFIAIRRIAEGSDEQVMVETQRAMMHLANIEELLAGMEAANRRVGAYKTAVSRWREWVMAFPSSWIHEQSSNEFVRDSDLHLLEALADALDQTQPVFAEGDRSAIRATLDDIR